MSPWMDWWTDLHDRQRLERLQQCRRLQEHLTACQQQAAAANTTKPLARKSPMKAGEVDGIAAVKEVAERDIEHIVPGLRMMKYFGWRGIHKSAQNDDEDNDKIKHVLDQTCAREQHALWACRAVAIGCGSELVQLRNCFDGEGAMPVLTQPQTLYESPVGSGSKKKLKKIPCGAIQQEVGQCVHKGMQALVQREGVRKSKSSGVIVQPPTQKDHP
jgi:hypothetical protein